MIFDRPSTRTRVSFDVGMRELGGETIMLTGAEMQLGRGETIADTARVLSRFVEAIIIRVLSEDDVVEMAAHATIPVINGLTKQSHPCQVLADLMTFQEKRGRSRAARSPGPAIITTCFLPGSTPPPGSISRSTSPVRANCSRASAGSTPRARPAPRSCSAKARKILRRTPRR